MKLTPYQKYRLQILFRRTLILCIIASVGVGLKLRGCESDVSNRIIAVEEERSSTSQELTNATITSYDDTLKTWRLVTEKLIQNQETKQLHVAPVDLKMFSDSGDVTTHVVSDSGLTTSSGDNFFVWGNVVITDVDGNTMRSQSLSWDKESRILSSNDYVEIRTFDDEMMRGKGFEAAEDFSWWEFKSNVSGEYNNVDEDFITGDEQ